MPARGTYNNNNDHNVLMLRVETRSMLSHRLRILITVGAISTLPVDSVIHKAMGRWHHAVTGSREEVVRYLRSVEAEFRIPGERTSDGKLKGWAVSLAWGEAGELAESGRSKTMVIRRTSSGSG